MTILKTVIEKVTGEVNCHSINVSFPASAHLTASSFKRHPGVDASQFTSHVT